MGDASLKLLLAAEGGLLGVADDVDDGDAIETDHLLEVDEALAVPIGKVDRGRVVRPVRVGLEEAAPLAPGVGVRRHVQEDGIRRRFQNGVSLRLSSALKVSDA